MAHIKKALGDDYDSVEFVKADLLDEQAMEDAMEGATYLIHTASPFPAASPKTRDEVIKPAVDGTLYALQGA